MESATAWSALREAYNLGADGTNADQRAFMFPAEIEALCPTSAVVALTSKPLIPAATQGPLGAYFCAPEHMFLRTEAGEASLAEIKAFADSVGYPVLIKGKAQGAAVCAGWQAVRAVISLQQWAQGGFVQQHVRGWERCLAFAAYKGALSGNRLA
jgi:hypothetical protein